MDSQHGPPSRIDRSHDESLTEDDERSLEAIRRQLETEFPHSSETVTVPGPAPRRRGVRLTTVLGVLLACASGGAAAVLLTPRYQALVTQPTVDRASPPAAPAPVTDITATARPATLPPPPVRAEARAEPASRPRATRSPEAPVPDVIWVRAAAPASTAPAAFVVAPRVAAAPPPVEGNASAPPAPVASVPPLESAVAAVPPVPLPQRASEHVRAAWTTVKERSGPEAP